MRPDKIGRLLSLTLILIFLVEKVATTQSCPSICTCKWKNGKRWVECPNQNQISIPDQIDMETQVLDLSGNNLQILPREVFARHGLLNLQKLHLSHCKIGQIDPTAFRGLTNLVELNLAGNLLTTIPTATFADIPYLRSLHLDRNPLQKVEANAFEMIPQLVSLDLSHCNIKRVAAKAFAQLTSLEKLFLQHNHISELRQKTVESITGLHAIELGNNPWACDCRLRPLKQWLVSNNVPHSLDPTCDSPPRLAGQQFANLQVDEFACPPELLSAPRYVEANVGENATLSCKIGSVPSSKVRWYRDGTEVLNNSLVNRGQQKFVIFEQGTFEKSSALILTNARPEDSGPFMCVSQNQAGRVEANFTLQVGYFVGGVASLESGEIAGIAVTFSAVALVLLVLLLVFLVRQRQCSSMVFSKTSTTQQTNGHLTVVKQEEKATTNGHAIHQNLKDSEGGGDGEMLTNVTNFGVEQTPAALLHQEMTGGNVYINGVSPDLIQGSPISRHSYVNQAVNFSPAHYSTLQNQRQIIRPTPQRIGKSTLESDQLYPDDYSYQGGGYFNPLESTLPRGMYQAVNPLKDYGYPSDFGLPMASMASSCYITSNPLSELEENTTQRQQATPQILAKTNLSNSSTASAASTLSPLRGHLSSSGIVGDLSTASAISENLYAKVNKRIFRKRESPDEGIQDDVSTDV